MKGNNMEYQKFSWIDIPESELLKKGLCDEYEFWGIVDEMYTRAETLIETYQRTGIELTATEQLDADYKYTANDGETHYIFIF